jgi:hypothetical protein
MSRVFVLAVTLFLGGCAGSAPALPPAYGAINGGRTLSDADFSTAELKKSCEEIDAEQAELVAHVRTLRGETAELHEDNQNIGFAASLLFPPAWIATSDTSEQAAEIRQLQSRWDHLLALERHKGCRAAASSG